MATANTFEPNYDVLIEALLEKTRTGKLPWEETAETDTFIAAVKGVQTFEISANRVIARVPEIGALPRMTKKGTKVEFGPPLERIEETVVTLTVRGPDGKILIDFESKGRDSLAYELHQAAKRVAMRIDERIGESVELLRSL